MSELFDKKCVPCEGGVPALDISEIHKYQKKRFKFWSGQRDLNPRPSRWQRDALPLSYARNLISII